MLDLAKLWRSGGLDVREVAGWQTRQRPGSWAPCFGVVHHTAGTKSLPIIVNGRPDLAGPLANAHFPKDGTVNLVSGGRCNHAGAGAQAVLDRARLDLAPRGPAAMLAYPDGPVGNGFAYGFELENLGDGRDPWPEPQLNAAALAAALLCRQHRWSANRWVGHLEWTRRKVDPRGFGMSAFRDRVRWLLTELGATPPAPPARQLPQPAVYFHPEDHMRTETIEIELDSEGRGNEPSGCPTGEFVSLEVLAGVVPNVNGYYPGDAGKPKPECWPTIENDQITVIARGGDPKFPITVLLTRAD